MITMTDKIQLPKHNYYFYSFNNFPLSWLAIFLFRAKIVPLFQITKYNPPNRKSLQYRQLLIDHPSHCYRPWNIFLLPTSRRIIQNNLTTKKNQYILFVAKQTGVRHKPRSNNSRKSALRTLYNKIWHPGENPDWPGQ